MNSSIMSFVERGNYGDNKYRGNCSGHVIKSLIEFFQPNKFFDAMGGSGTSEDVCKEMGVDCIIKDLSPKYGGWDALNDEVPESSDFTFIHPPYWDMIKYSGSVWGSQPDTRDLSHCQSYPEFISKLNKINEKLLYSLRRGGRLGILVGDIKRAGKLFSIQKDMSWYGSPEYVLIKEQHNVFSRRIKYNGKFIPLSHEYLLIFKRDDCFLIPHKIVSSVNFDIRNKVYATWKDLILAVLQKLGGKASLDRIYETMKDFEKCKTHQFWKEKVRQVLQSYKDFERVEKGVYALSFI